MNKTTALLLLALLPFTIIAGEADVVDVKATCQLDVKMTCRFDVTVSHADTGWDHYANKWDVLTPDGKVLASRVLYHPHVDEQPFKRSLDSVSIPEGIKTVIIRAHDSVHETGGKELSVKLEK